MSIDGCESKGKSEGDGARSKKLPWSNGWESASEKEMLVEPISLPMSDLLTDVQRPNEVLEFEIWQLLRFYRQ